MFPHTVFEFCYSSAARPSDASAQLTESGQLTMKCPTRAPAVNAPKKDRRIEKSKQALRSASLQLMLEKGYEAMTVSDIVERANVGRSTFYAHFADKEDLMQENLQGLRDYLESQAKLRDAEPIAVHPALAFSLPMLLHVYEQRQMFQGLVRPIAEMMHSMLVDHVKERLFASDDVLGGPIDLVAEFIVGAFLSVCVWWMNADSQLQAEQVDKFFREIASRGLLSARD